MQFFYTALEAYFLVHLPIIFSIAQLQKLLHIARLLKGVKGPFRSKIYDNWFAESIISNTLFIEPELLPSQRTKP